MSALSVVLWAGLPSVASAQERKGFWIGLNVGVGSAGVSADDVAGTLDEEEDRDAGGVADLSLGWAFSHQLLLGLDLYAWTKPPQGGTLTVNLERVRDRHVFSERFVRVLHQGWGWRGGRRI